MSCVPKPLDVGISVYVRHDCPKCKFFEFLVSKYNSMVYNAEQAYTLNRQGFINEMNDIAGEQLDVNGVLYFPLIFINGKRRREIASLVDDIIGGTHVSEWMPSYVALYGIGKVNRHSRDMIHQTEL
jgi:hypothetical protein